MLLHVALRVAEEASLSGHEAPAGSLVNAVGWCPLSHWYKSPS
jgi:hypothetical protein